MPAFVIGEDVVVGLDINKIDSLMDYTVVDCPDCKTRLRIPKGKGKLKVNCPKCSRSFFMNT